MKSICFVNPYTVHNSIGGAEVQNQILAEESVKRGYQVYFITYPAEIPKNNSSKINYISFNETGNLEEDIKNFTRIVDEINPDIIYQRGRKLWTIYVGAYLKKRTVKLVFASSMDIDCYKHKFLFRKPRSLRDIYKRIKVFNENYKIDKYSLETINHATIVLSQTEKQKELFLKNLNISSIQFPNIHPSVEEDLQKKSDPVKILWIANIKRWKQPEVFLRLARELKDLDCSFLMAGELSKPRYRNEIDLTAKINPNFNYLGAVAFEKSNKLMAEADIFINTSDLEEGFPNTFIQSWLRKTPTISLNFDPDNLITKHQLGYVTNTFDLLVKKTTKLVLDKDLRKEIGNRASKFAHKNYSTERKSDEFFNIIENQKI